MTKDELIELAQVGMGIHSPNAPEYIVCEALIKALSQPEPWEKFCDSNCVWTDHHPDCKLAEQEPVAWKTDDVELYVREDKFGFYNIPLYTHPPQRTWVGLTDEEMQDLWDRYAHMEMMRAIEAKLKEKNT